MPSHPTLQSAASNDRCEEKSLSDASAKKIDPKPYNATVNGFTIIKPDDETPWKNRKGIEFRTYRIIARIDRYKMEKFDGDLHMLLSDPDDPSKIIVAEVPDPDCPESKKSGLAGEYRTVRDKIAGYSTTNTNGLWHYLEDVKYEIIGVGFLTSGTWRR